MFHVTRLAWPMAVACSILVSLVAIAAHFRGWPVQHALNVVALLIVGAMVLFATLCWWPQDEPMLDGTSVQAPLQPFDASKYYLNLGHLAETEAGSRVGPAAMDINRVAACTTDLPQIEPVPGGFRARRSEPRAS